MSYSWKDQYDLRAYAKDDVKYVMALWRLAFNHKPKIMSVETQSPICIKRKTRLVRDT